MFQDIYILVVGYTVSILGYYQYTCILMFPYAGLVSCQSLADVLDGALFP